MAAGVWGTRLIFIPLPLINPGALPSFEFSSPFLRGLEQHEQGAI